MEQRITRAKARVADADVPFETPGAVERSERLAAVAAMIYLIFNEGYSASGDTAEIRKPLCEEAIRLARLLLRLFQSEPEIMGLTALLLLQHARAAARFDAEGAVILLDDQDRSLVESEDDRRGAGADRQGDAASPQRALSDPGGDRGVACPRRKARRHRLDPDRSALRRAGGDAAVAGGDAQPRRRGVQGARRRGGAGDDRAAGVAAVELFSFLRRARRVPDAARPQRGGPHRLRPRHRARQHLGGSRPHPHASRPPDARQHPARREGEVVRPARARAS